MRRHTVSPAAVLFSIIGASAIMTAQAPFGSRIDLVAMDVSATNREGRAAPLEASDLAVLDNGVRQQIVMFSAGDRVPLAVSLLGR